MNLPKYSPGAPTTSTFESAIQRERESLQTPGFKRDQLLNSFRAPPPQPSAPDPMATQVGGAHYKDKKIQPVEFSHANNLGFLEGCIVKRITRWREKNGIQDLEKIKHEVDLLIAMEKKYGRDT